MKKMDTVFTILAIMTATIVVVVVVPFWFYNSLKMKDESLKIGHLGLDVPGVAELGSEPDRRSLSHILSDVLRCLVRRHSPCLWWDQYKCP